MQIASRAIRVLLSAWIVFGLITLVHADNAARDKLLFSMRRHSWSLSAIITRSQVDSDYPFQHQVKIDFAPSGRMRQTILQPVSLQGIVSIDDGQILSTLYPNDRLLVYQSSPSKVEEDSDLRIQLAVRNYRLSLSNGPSIAKRSTIQIVAKPNSKELNEKRFYLDKQNNYLLRIEIVQGSKVKTLLDTQSIKYSINLPSNVFEMNTLGRLRTEHRQRPESLPDSGYLGFRLIVPNVLPYGFANQGAQYVPGSPLNAAIYRLTDGLAKVTVYQYVSNGRPAPSGNSQNSAQAKGFTFVVVSSDVSARVRAEILDSFIEKALSRP